MTKGPTMSEWTTTINANDESRIVYSAIGGHLKNDIIHTQTRNQKKASGLSFNPTMT